MVWLAQREDGQAGGVRTCIRPGDAKHIEPRRREYQVQSIGCRSRRSSGDGKWEKQRPKRTSSTLVHLGSFQDQQILNHDEMLGTRPVISTGIN